MDWVTPKPMTQGQNPAFNSGIPYQAEARATNGSRNVNRPQTLMMSSSSCPRCFMEMFRSTWNRADKSANTNHMSRTG